ncbi:MAG: hypothetical protein AUK27_08115 [Deltaproteobacteria bacterium CG2_30_66_27]|nr:MAG: hypothetical protein AUK27_08115 [Deltaproteobacteria bacterium CG2_30_66_27]PJB31269.1 MAG: hypothetical protein CO109_10890 [Deltaproteobacteria bacterium CG_4_9_14_3_um_filter_65_9]
MNRGNAIRKVALLISVVFVAAAFSACGGGSASNVKAEEKSPAEEKITPLAHRYSKLVFQGFTADSQITTDYPTALSECESAAMAAVISKNLFDAVEKEKKGVKYGNALLVKGSVVSMRIVSGAARFWAGAMAGTSDMSVKLTFTDAATGAVVREKLLSSANNPWGAAWTYGGSDRSLPADMGRIIGEYVAAITPAK